MDYTVVSYAVYLPIAVGVTIWVARTLSRNGRLFLTTVFPGDEKLADAVNHLLVVGFYLINLGFVVLWMRTSEQVTDLQGVFNTLSVKLGSVLLAIGWMHLGNVYVLNRIRRRGSSADSIPPRPPVAPQGWTPQPAQA
ncbi:MULTISPECIES: hypothetical protein [unclassified Kitasatospora]|uniref:hypothetical protein n=1 Tax=unclassified Kitasatospora TaxID=2633591 RepID=UPI00070C9969|nr:MULTISPECIES: hypothetical protein [unclassified Kitasatospora]KQV19774.1 hypothetical protein ASC99_22500 [Kitasatospora sp. Root107]KRB61325.1 hypothetical protein ASE03_09600 [Kitasatospora sp. Root187]